MEAKDTTWSKKMKTKQKLQIKTLDEQNELIICIM